MKKLALFLVAIIAYVFLFSQEQNMYVDLNTPSEFNSPMFSGNWNLSFEDDFNSTHSSIWAHEYCWGNTSFAWPFYNLDSYVIDSPLYVRLKADYNISTVVPDDNYVEREYLCGMLDSDPCIGTLNAQDTFETENHTWKYGYFEAEIRTPKSEYMSPAFWLFGEPNSSYSNWNEIDIFELATGDGLVQGIISQIPNESATHINRRYIYSIPGQTYGNTWVKYGLKWEPNKVIWYINDKPVRMVTDVSDPLIAIPNVAMRVLLTNQVYEVYSGSGYYLNKDFPNYMDVNYLEVYQRADHSLPDPVFLINNSYGFNTSSAVVVPFNNNARISLDASQSYMPSHQYFVSIARCDASGNVYFNETEALGWLTPQEVEDIDDFDLNAYATSKGLPLLVNNYYRVRVSGNPWSPRDQYIYTTTCQNSVSFKINGVSNTSFPTPIDVDFNNGKPRIICDASNIVSCNNQISLSIFRCTSSGFILRGSSVSRLLNETEIEYLDCIDLEKFYGSFGKNFTLGYYYLVKFTTGSNPAVSQSQVIHINSCNDVASFHINDLSYNWPTPVIIEPGDKILLDCSDSRFCDSHYFLSVQECDINGNVVSGATEYYDDRVLIYRENNGEFDPTDIEKDQCYYYDIGRLNLRAFAVEQNFSFECGKFYGVKLAGYQPSWTEIVRLIYIDECLASDMNNSIWINGSNDQSVTIPSVDNTVYLYSKDGVACNGYYFLSIQKIVNWIPVGVEANRDLSLNDPDINSAYYLLDLGAFDLTVFAKDPNMDGVYSDGFTFESGATYKLKFVPRAGGCNSNVWDENVKYITFGGSKSQEDNGEYSVLGTEIGLNTEVKMYPNPAQDILNLQTANSNLPYILELSSSEGRLLHRQLVEDQNSIVDLDDYQSGLYLIRLFLPTKTICSRIIISK